MVQAVEVAPEPTRQTFPVEGQPQLVLSSMILYDVHEDAVAPARYAFTLMRGISVVSLLYWTHVLHKDVVAGDSYVTSQLPTVYLSLPIII
jgi:hypothetical protein